MEITAHLEVAVFSALMRRYLVDLPASGELNIPEGIPVGAVLKQLRVPPESEKGCAGKWTPPVLRVPSSAG